MKDYAIKAWNWAKRKVVGAVAVVTGVTAATVAVSSPAHAVDTTLADLFTAANISGLNSNVGTLLIGFIGIGLLFLGRRYLARTGIR